MNKQATVEKSPIHLERSPQLGTTVLFPQRQAEDPHPVPGPVSPDVAKPADVDEPKKAKKQKKEPGSARGIETMFRTAYRAQLDLTALGATKANIMISLNGLILSVLTLSGPFVLVAEPMFTAPIAVFNRFNSVGMDEVAPLVALLLLLSLGTFLLLQLATRLLPSMRPSPTAATEPTR